MKHSALLRKVSIVGVSAACALALAGCDGSNYGYTGGVAATVNGTEIQEDTITKYIQDFRTSADLTSDDDWGNWMAENSFDPSTVRSQVIDYYVEDELLKQACDDQGVTVEDSEVDEQYNDMKANYEDEEAWENALSEAGMTDDSYRESIKKGLRESKLQDAVAADAATADDASVLEMMNTYYTMFDGAKKSSHILFASGDEATAQEVLDKINSGELDFAEAAKQYSTDEGSKEDGGNVGWDCINTFVDAYTEALDGLEKDQVSGLVTSDYGIHIIKCTDTFSCDGTATSLDAYPAEMVEYIRGIVEDQNKANSYDEWFDNYKEQADIQTNDMPENVPYNLDMTQYESDDDSSTTTEESTDGTTDESTDESTDTTTDESATEESTDASTEEGTEENSGE